MGFDYIGARNEGYSDAEIAGELKRRGVNMDVSGASKEGYGAKEIAAEINRRFDLLKTDAPPKKQSDPKPTAWDNLNLSQKPQYSVPQTKSDDTHTTTSKTKIEVRNGKPSTAPIVNPNAKADEDVSAGDIAQGVAGAVIGGAKETAKLVGYNAAKHAAAVNEIANQREGAKYWRENMHDLEKDSAILSGDDEVLKMGAKMVTDPLTYTPLGIFNKGKKAWDVVKSTVAGGAIGAGLAAEDELGRTGTIESPNVALGAGIGAGINAVLSYATHGKFKGSAPEKAEVPEHPENTPVQDDDIAGNIVDGWEAKAKEESIAKAKAEQDQRVQAAHEEAMARKAQYESTQQMRTDVNEILKSTSENLGVKLPDVPHVKHQEEAISEDMARKAALEEEQASALKAKEEADAQYQSDVETIQNHPRFNELIESRRNVSARESQSPNVRESDRQIIHENNGNGYETMVIPATDTRNYAYDFTTTKADVSAYEKNGMSPALVEKFKRDLEVYDNHPDYRASEPMGRVEGDKYIDDLTGEEVDIPFSKGNVAPVAIHSIESIAPSLESALGKKVSEKLAPIMSVITKSEIPESVLAKAKNDPEGIHGFVHDGKAYLVADSIPKEWSQAQVRGLVMHEVGVHLRKVGDVEAFDRVVARVKTLAQNDKRVQEAYARVPKDTEAHLVDEEALAYLVQHHADMGIVKQLIAWARAALRKMGIDHAALELNADDLVAMAWGSVKRGDGSVVSRDTMFMSPVKSKAQKEKRGIYNVQNNGKISTIIYKDADFVDEALKFEKGKSDYIDNMGKDKNGFGALHIAKHLGNEKKGWISDKELMNIGDAIRNTEPEIAKNGNRIYQYHNTDGVRFRIIVGNKKNGERIISFYSNRKAGFGYDSQNYIYNRPLNKSVHQSVVQSQEPQFSRVQAAPEAGPVEPQSAPEGHKTGGFFSVAKRAIETMSNKMNVGAFRNYLKGKGVKNDEMIYGGIEKAIEGKETVTKAEMMEALNNPEMRKVTRSFVPNEEVVMDFFGIERSAWDGMDETSQHMFFQDMLEHPHYKGKGNTKYQKYSLKDVGENYREELTKFSTEDDFKNWVEKNRREDDPTWEQIKSDPGMYREYHEAFKTEEPTKYRSSHWDEPNVLYHVRKQDTTIDGEKTLLIEEIQSDWHQAGRKHGYSTARDEYNKLDTELSAIKDRLIAEHGNKWINASQNDEEFNRVADMMKEAGDRMQKEYDAVPQAPYAKNWHEKALKDQIDEAVRKGYDRVAWVDGKTSVDRYSLSKSVDRLVYNKDVGIVAGYKNGEEILYKSATDNDLASLIGKDPAKKLMDNEVHPGVYEIKGEALDIGGDGMRGFYDKILPDYARKYVKKWGAEVEKKTLSDGTEVWSFPVTKEMYEDVTINGQALYMKGVDNLLVGMYAGIGEDENGNITFDPSAFVMGLGGYTALKAFVKNPTVQREAKEYAIRALNELDKKSYAQYITGEMNIMEKVSRKAVGATPKEMADATRQAASDIAEGGSSKLRDNFTMNKTYEKLVSEKHSGMAEELEEALIIHKAFSQLSLKSNMELQRYIVGEESAENLSKNMVRLGDAVKVKIEKLSQELVDLKLLDKETFEAYRGNYIKRIYDKYWFGDPERPAAVTTGLPKSYARGAQIETDDAQKVHAYLSKYGDAKGLESLRAANESMDELLYDASQKGYFGEKTMGGIKIEMKDNGKVSLDRDWTKSEREEMGEIENAALTVPNTLAILTSEVHTARMFKKIATETDIVYRGKETDEAVIRGLGFERIPQSKRYGALAGKWVKPSVAKDLKYMQNIGPETERWLGYLSLWKQSKTVWNAGAHFNNFSSNIMLRFMAGDNNPFANMGEAIGAMKGYDRIEALKVQKLSNGLSETEVKELQNLTEKHKYMVEAKNIGLFGKSQINDILHGFGGSDVLKAKTSVLGKINNIAQDMYSAEDSIVRLAMYMSKRKAGMNPKAAQQEIEAIIPDYTRPLPVGVKIMRDSGVSPFISWTYYVLPNIIKLAKDRPGRALTVLGMVYGGSELAMQIMGQSNANLPADTIGRRIGYYVDDEGNIDTLKVDRIIPGFDVASIPLNTIVSAWEGYKEGDGSLSHTAWEGMKGGTEALTNFLTSLAGGPVVSAIYPLISKGKDSYSGRKIIGENQTDGQEMLNILTWVHDKFGVTPVEAVNIIKFAHSQMVEPQERKQYYDMMPRTTAQEAFKVFGINGMTYDPRATEKAREKAQEKYQKLSGEEE